MGIFLSMASGIAAGMGYLGLGLIFVVFIIVALFLLENVVYKKDTLSQKKKTLRIMIPEDLDYENVFTDVLDTY